MKRILVLIFFILFSSFVFAACPSTFQTPRNYVCPLDTGETHTGTYYATQNGDLYYNGVDSGGPLSISIYLGGTRLCEADEVSTCIASVSAGNTYTLKATATNSGNYLLTLEFFTTTTPSLKENGESCSSNSECHSGNCNHVCCGAGETCCTSNSHCELTQVCDSTYHYCIDQALKEIGEYCSAYSVCASGNCQNNICCAAGETCCTYDTHCDADETCNTTYHYCVSSYEPEPEPSPTPSTGTKQYCESCSSDSQCASDYCGDFGSGEYKCANPDGGTYCCPDGHYISNFQHGVDCCDACTDASGAYLTMDCINYRCVDWDDEGEEDVDEEESTDEYEYNEEGLQYCSYTSDCVTGYCVDWLCQPTPTTCGDGRCDDDEKYDDNDEVCEEDCVECESESDCPRCSTGNCVNDYFQCGASFFANDISRNCVECLSDSDCDEGAGYECSTGLSTANTCVLREVSTGSFTLDPDELNLLECEDADFAVILVHVEDNEAYFAFGDLDYWEVIRPGVILTKGLENDQYVNVEVESVEGDTVTVTVSLDDAPLACEAISEDDISIDELREEIIAEIGGTGEEAVWVDEYYELSASGNNTVDCGSFEAILVGRDKMIGTPEGLVVQFRGESILFYEHKDFMFSLTGGDFDHMFVSTNVDTENETLTMRISKEGESLSCTTLQKPFEVRPAGGDCIVAKECQSRECSWHKCKEEDVTFTCNSEVYSSQTHKCCYGTRIVGKNIPCETVRMESNPTLVLGSAISGMSAEKATLYDSDNSLESYFQMHLRNYVADAKTWEEVAHFELRKGKKHLANSKNLGYFDVTGKGLRVLYAVAGFVDAITQLPEQLDKLSHLGSVAELVQKRDLLLSFTDNLVTVFGTITSNTSAAEEMKITDDDYSLFKAVKENGLWAIGVAASGGWTLLADVSGKMFGENAKSSIAFETEVGNISMFASIYAENAHRIAQKEVPTDGEIKEYFHSVKTFIKLKKLENALKHRDYVSTWKENRDLITSFYAFVKGEERVDEVLASKTARLEVIAEELERMEQNVDLIMEESGVDLG